MVFLEIRYKLALANHLSRNMIVRISMVITAAIANQ